MIESLRFLALALRLLAPVASCDALQNAQDDLARLDAHTLRSLLHLVGHTLLALLSAVVVGHEQDAVAQGGELHLGLAGRVDNVATSRTVQLGLGDGGETRPLYSDTSQIFVTENALQTWASASSC